MVNIALRPPPRSMERILTYLNENFNRVSDTFARIPGVAHGVVGVQGDQDVDTGLVEVDTVVASLEGAPVSGAAFVRARVPNSSNPGIIRITIYTSSFGTSSTTRAVNWIAVGR